MANKNTKIQNNLRREQIAKMRADRRDDQKNRSGKPRKER